MYRFLSSSNIRQAGDCVGSSGLLLVNYCPVQLEVQLKGQGSFRDREGEREWFGWVRVEGEGKRRETKCGGRKGRGERERIQEYEYNNAIVIF